MHKTKRAEEYSRAFSAGNATDCVTVLALSSPASNAAREPAMPSQTPVDNRERARNTGARSNKRTLVQSAQTLTPMRSLAVPNGQDKQPNNNEAETRSLSH